MKQILINVEPYEKRVAIVRRGELEEFHVERADQMPIAGNIYKGIIDSIVPGIGAIFVNIGIGKNGFLYIDDLEGRNFTEQIGEDIIVEKTSQSVKNRFPKEQPKKGQELIVQVVKEPIGTKGALLTSNISLAGKYVVLMPFNETIGVSKRIENVHERSRLKDVLRQINPPKGVGCVVRTQSSGVNPRQLKLEFRYLMNLWSRVQGRAKTQKSPSVIYEEYDLPLRMIRDHIEEDVEKIMIDSREEYKKITRFANIIQPKLKRKIFYYRGKASLYENYGIESQIEEIFHRKIFLKSGGSIVIEQTEGMIAIDVNTGRFTGKRNPEETVFKTNMEAASEIARQVMLRDIGGIIIIDFIDMAEREHRKRVHEELENAFKKDKAKINIFPISQIGVVEMTRQRIRKSLQSVSFQECPYCNGMGHVKTPATIAIEALRKLERILTESRSREVRLFVHPDVAECIGVSFADILRSLERYFRKRITVKNDSKLHVEDIHFE